MWSTARCQNQRAIDDALSPKVFKILVCSVKIRSKDACAASLRATAALEDAAHSRAASWDSKGSKEISRPGLSFCESSGFCGSSWIRKFQSSQDGVNASVSLSRDLSTAAGFTMLEMKVQELSTLTALTEACVGPVAESLLHVGDVVVRCEDAARTRVYYASSVAIGFCQTTGRAAP